VAVLQQQRLHTGNAGAFAIGAGNGNGQRWFTLVETGLLQQPVPDFCNSA
jgi:hypothetical protein